MEEKEEVEGEKEKLEEVKEGGAEDEVDDAAVESELAPEAAAGASNVNGFAEKEKAGGAATVVVDDV